MDFKKLMRPHLMSVKPYIPGKPIEELRRERNIEGEIIKLASNENPHHPIEEIKQAIIEEIDNLNRYPDSGCHYLVTDLAAKHDIDRGNIFVGNGSNEIIELLVRAFVNPGENVLYPWPSFIAYPLIIHQAGVDEVKVPLVDYTLDLSSMKSAVTQKTKVVFICNPNNPTATYVPQGDVEMFLDGLRQDVLVVFDEAYYEYITAEDFPETQELLRQYRNVVILRTFSKAFALSGVRVGYAMADEGIVTALHKVRQPFNVNRIAQAAARAALKHAEKHGSTVEINNKERERLTQELRDLGFIVPHSQTNFILAVPEVASENLVDRLMDLGVIVRGMAPFGLGEGSIRVSIGTPEENDRFLESLKKVL
jgi:histidinol-phosphate aminotransferase